MKYLVIVVLLSSIMVSNLLSDEKNCKDLVNKPIEWSKCVAQKSVELGKEGSKKLNTDSKLTDWVKKKLGK